MSVTGTGERPRYEDARSPVDVVEIDLDYNRDQEYAQLVRCLKDSYLWDTYKESARDLFYAGLCARDTYWLIFVNEDQGLDTARLRDVSAYRLAVLRNQWGRSHEMIINEVSDQLLAALGGHWGGT